MKRVCGVPLYRKKSGVPHPNKGLRRAAVLEYNRTKYV